VTTARPIGRWGSRAGMRHFAYLNARVQAMRGRLLPKETYAKLLQMEIPQIARFLGETEYKAEIEQLGKRYRGVDLVEYALNMNLAKTMHGLIGKAQFELRELLELYLRRYDQENITTILRGKLSGVPPQEVREALIPAGSLKLEQLHALIDASYDDTLEMLRRMGRGYIVDLLTERPLPEVEDEMRRQYFRELLEATAGGGRSNEQLRRFVRTEIDFRNLNNLLRLKRDGESPERIMAYMIDDGLFLSAKHLRSIAAMELPEIVRELGKLLYFRATVDALESASDSLVAFEAALTREELRHTSKEARTNPLSILVALSYILAKQVEVYNVRNIVRGKEGGIPLELIRRQLVI